MSVKTALDNIHLRPCDSWAHTEYSLEYHKAYHAARTGLAQESPDLFPKAWNRLAMDFRWSTQDGLVNWSKAGRVTDMGHAAYASDGSDQRVSAESPFKSAEEVWAFDAVAEYGLPNLDEQVAAYEKIIQDARKRFPEQLTTGGYYKTLVSGALEAFGWEMLLEAAADRGKMEKVFDSFFRRTLFHMQAWAKTSAEVIIQHDDFVWTSGPFMHPDIYRKVIIPRYAELWKPIHAAGKKLLFCSDGLFTDYAQDIVEAGADGLIFEPCNDFGFMADRFGQSHCLVGSFVDCRVLTFEKWDRVMETMDRTFDKLRNCKGAILAVGNHLPSNVPETMLDKYFEHLIPRLKRNA